MTFVGEHTNIRLPSIIDAWEFDDHCPIDDRKLGYILMDYIDGRIIQSIWLDLSPIERQDILLQVRDFLQQLHSLSVLSPGPIGGGVSRGPLFTDYTAGPFHSVDDMEAWFNECLIVCQEFGRASKSQPSLTGQFSRLVMCHLDVAPRNLILDHQGKIWMLDWAFAGGYPEHFEWYTLARDVGASNFTKSLLETLGPVGYEDEVQSLFKIGFALTTAAYTRPAGAPPRYDV
jgi:hypothetical protein